MALPYSVVSASLRAAVSAWPKVALYSNVKPVFAQRVPHLAPRLAPGPLVSLVDEDQVVPSKTSTGTRHALALFSITSLVISVTLDRVGFELSQQPALVQVESPGRDAGRLQARPGAARVSPSFGVISTMLSNRFTVVLEVLPVVQVHQQRLAAARRHPERQLLQVGLLVPLHALVPMASLVQLGDVPVQRIEKLGGASAVAVEEHLRVQRGKVLEVAQCNRLRPARVHGGQVLADVVVVPLQVRGGYLQTAPGRNPCVDVAASVPVEPLGRRPYVVEQPFGVRVAQQVVQPRQQYQPLLKPGVGCATVLALADAIAGHHQQASQGVFQGCTPANILALKIGSTALAPGMMESPLT